MKFWAYQGTGDEVSWGVLGLRVGQKAHTSHTAIKDRAIAIILQPLIRRRIS